MPPQAHTGWPAEWPALSGFGTHGVQPSLPPSAVTGMFGHGHGHGAPPGVTSLFNEVGSLRSRVDQLRAALAESPKSNHGPIGLYGEPASAWGAPAHQQAYAFSPVLRQTPASPFGSAESRIPAVEGSDEKGKPVTVNINVGSRGEASDPSSTQPASAVPQVASAEPSQPPGFAQIEKSALQGLEERVQSLSRNLSECKQQMQMQHTTNEMLVKELQLTRQEQRRALEKPPRLPVGLEAPATQQATNLGHRYPSLGSPMTPARGTHLDALSQKDVQVLAEPAETVLQSGRSSCSLVHKLAEPKDARLDTPRVPVAAEFLGSEHAHSSTPNRITHAAEALQRRPASPSPCNLRLNFRPQDDRQSPHRLVSEMPRMQDLGRISASMPLLENPSTPVSRTPRPALAVPLTSVWSSQQHAWQYRMKDLDHRLETLDSRFRSLLR